MIPTRTLLLLALAIVLAGCLPTSLRDGRPDAAVLGVPAEVRVPGAADALQDRLAELPTGFDLVPPTRVRFLETRSGLVSGAVDRGAARIARRTGGDVAVALGARGLRRELVGPSHAPVERVALRLEATLLRAEDATVLARVRGPRLRARRGLHDEELPPLADDALVAALVDRSLDDLAPRVAAELAALATGSSGE